MQYLFPLLAVFIWAGNTVVNKLAVGIIQPAEIGFFRWLLVGLALMPFMLGPVLRNRRYILANLGKFVVLGLLGMAVYQSLAYYAAALTSATNMGIILSLMPLMSLGLASSILAHRLNAGALLGALVSLAGVVLVISQGHLGALLEHGVNLGDAMMIVATLAYAVYSVLLKKWSLKLPAMQLLYLQVLVAIAWLTYFLYHVDSLRGTFMVFYVLALLFGVFQLPPRVFARCAALAFIAFSGIYLVEALQQRLELPGRAALQVLVMFIVMVWLSLFASYIQAMRQRMRQRRYALQAHQDTLRGMMRQLEDLVATDELTGLFNRRHFMRMASRALEDLLPNRQHGLALIDLDHFKRINDRHGHAAGDRVLQTFAAVARSCLRDGDVLARYGGEEFVLLLPHADAEQLESCCERLRLAFQQAEPVGVTVDTLSLSVGMTLLYADDDLDEALQRADQALYRAKRGGRNRCDATWEVTSA